MIRTILLFLILLSVSLNLKAGNEYKKQQTVVCGKISNYDSSLKTISGCVNLIGVPRLNVSDSIDRNGNFIFRFDIYTPTDLWIDYRTNFLVLIHPGDSIYLEFDGNANNRPELLNTIKFSGDAALSNKEAASFQNMYFSSDLYNNRKWKQNAIEQYELDDYKLFLDTLQAKQNNLLEEFIRVYNPSNEAKVWSSLFIQTPFIDALFWYPNEHRFKDQSKPSFCLVPVNYYNPLLNLLPIQESQLISGFSLMNYTDRYNHSYALYNMLAEESKRQLKTEIGYIAMNVTYNDSLLINGKLKFTQDPLLKQFVLADMFKRQFELNQIEVFEKYKSITDSIIISPYIKEPLFDFYKKIKNRIDNPQITSDAILRTLEKSTAHDIMDSILSKNKGKVIYIDCWADYCGPCRAEMPNSKKLMSKLKDKSIAFVFVCIDSNENKWKAILDEYQLAGQHYWLTKEQSNDWKKSFNITGVPNYIIINKNGNIIESGSHLRPNFAEAKINELLNEK
nr:TlpA disulfide reductase family protein [uncultured Carboxylicivirga sp.]